MQINGKSISKGIAKGKALVSSHRISFLGGIDPKNGFVIDKSLDIYEKNITGSVLIFPGGKGSTVGSYVIYQLKKYGRSPCAMVTRKADIIVSVGAIIADIPTVANLETDPIEGKLIKDGDIILVNGTKGYVEF